MINDYEELREKQLKYLEAWYQRLVVPTRKIAHHDHFSLSYGEIYALRIDDLVYFVNKNNMTFEFDWVENHIIFSDIKRR